MMHTRSCLVLVLALSLSGCGLMDRLKRPDPAPDLAPAAPASDLATEMVSPVETTVLGQTAAALDSTTPAEKAAALATPASGSERALGRVVVSLGSPAEQGIWLKTPLVTSATKGRVVTATGQSLSLDLLPGAGGAQLSLAAFQALGLNLTSLPEVAVFGP